MGWTAANGERVQAKDIRSLPDDEPEGRNIYQMCDTEAGEVTVTYYPNAGGDTDSVCFTIVQYDTQGDAGEPLCVSLDREDVRTLLPMLQAFVERDL